MQVFRHFRVLVGILAELVDLQDWRTWDQLDGGIRVEEVVDAGADVAVAAAGNAKQVLLLCELLDFRSDDVGIKEVHDVDDLHESNPVDKHGQNDDVVSNLGSLCDGDQFGAEVGCMKG